MLVLFVCARVDAYQGASFAKYLKERVVDKLPVAPASFEYVACCQNPEEAAAECA